MSKEKIAFDDDDLKGTMESHDDAIVVTLRIGGFLVKRVMVDYGWVEIMYPDLYKGLGLKDEDLTKYDMPLVGFDKKMVIPADQINLLMTTEGKEVIINFIVVHAILPYMAILAQLWIYVMGVVPIHYAIENNVPIRLRDNSGERGA